MHMTSTDPPQCGLTDVRDYLLDCGAFVVGVADLSGWPPARSGGYPRAICLGVAVRPDPILRLRTVRDRPAEADRAVDAALADLGQTAVRYLQRGGARAEILVPQEAPETLTHDDVAVQAGVAWIGKSGHPVTWDFGSAIRLTTVLTDADLAPDRPVTRSFCGTCLACTQACQARAPSGLAWAPGMAKAEFLNAAACRERRQQLAARGRDCRYCMCVCPFTAVYLLNCGLAVPTECSDST